MFYESTTVLKKSLSTIILLCLMLGNLGFVNPSLPQTLSTGILDNFNRANGSIGTNWSGYTNAFSIASNQLDITINGYDTYTFWKSTSFGADQEAYITFSLVDADAPEQSLLLKSQNNTSYGNGVIEVLYDANADVVQVWTYHLTNGWVQYGANIPVVFANGDQFGAHALANGTLEVYKNGTVLATRNITSWPLYASGGYIGLWFANASDALLDNFGGGTVTGASTNTPLPATSTTTPSSTPLPTSTRTPTATSTATATWTQTATAIPTSTFTLIPPSTPTFTSSAVPTATATYSPTSTFTNTPAATSTNTGTPMFGATNTDTPVYTPTEIPTLTPVLTYTDTGVPTSTATNSPTSTFTFTPTNTFTPTSTSTRTPTFTPTFTRTYTPTWTPTVTALGFPSTSVLDTFNRANGGIGSNWFGSTSGYRISSNRMDINTGGAIFWTAQFGTDQEAFVIITTVDNTGSEQDLLLKSQNRTTWTSGVIEVLYDPIGKRALVQTYSSSQGWVQRCTINSITLVTNDRFGARAKSNGMVDVYRNTTLLASCDTSAWTYTPNGGYIGLWFINSSRAFVDNFGGGNATGGTATNTPVPATSTLTPSPTLTTSPTPTRTLTPTSIYTPTETPNWTPTPTSIFSPTPTPTIATSPIVFGMGLGGADSVPHQIVRTNDDRLYIVVNQQSSTVIRVYRTVNAGLPNTASDFAAPIQITEASNPISVDAVYDGGTIIHVLVNLQNRQIKDYPFDTSTNTFKSPITLATDGGNFASPTYVGTSGISGMMDLNGNLHVVYWMNGNHIQHRAYIYDALLNTLTPMVDFTQVDSTGSANHPAIAVSPFDNSITIAWVSEATNPAQILARTRTSSGIWNNIEVVSSAPVWHSTDNGISIDQSPSLIIDSTGMKHLTYIEAFNSSLGDYGRIHYVTNTGSSWVDIPINALTHDPVLALNSRGEVYLIGHGHPRNSIWGTTCLSMDDMCTIKKNANGTWGPVTLLIAHTGTDSFDSSPSIKWSVVGFNRPESIEFIFFRTPYDNPVLYYARLP